MTDKENSDNTQAPSTPPPPPVTQQTLKNYTDADIAFLVEKDVPVVLAFPYEAHSGDCKSRKAVLSLSKNERIASRCSFGEVSAEKNPKAVQQFGISIVPAVAIVYRGKLVFISSGGEIDSQSALENCERLLSVLEVPDGTDESLSEMEKQARKNAIRAGKQLSSGSWEMVPISGLISGVVMAVSRYHLEGMTWLLPTGLVYAICITSGNFRFNAIQKFVATGIMFVIGVYWQEIMEFLRTTYQK